MSLTFNSNIYQGARFSHVEIFNHYRITLIEQLVCREHILYGHLQGNLVSKLSKHIVLSPSPIMHFEINMIH